MNEKSTFAKLKAEEPKKDKDEETEELLKRADDKYNGDEEDPEDEEEKSDKKDDSNSDPEEEKSDSTDKEKSDDKDTEKEEKSGKEDPEDECDDEDEDCKKKKEKSKKPVKESKHMKLMVDMSTDIISEVEINESTNNKTYVIKGTFSSPGKKNRNGRVYSNQIWEDNVKRYQNEIKNNTINTLSELEHPPRSTVDQWEAVAKTRLLEMRDGLVYGEMEILNNNDKKTNQIKALIDAGIKIGVSTRGVGRMKGSIVEEYNLITTDIVSNPSDFGANLQGFNESMILESEDYTVTDGKIVCNADGCSIVETAGDKVEILCSVAADSLLEAMNAYTAPVVELTEAQKKAKSLIEKSLKDNDGKKLKSFDYHGDTYKVVKVSKGEVVAVGPDGEEEVFDLDDIKSQDDNVAIIEGTGIWSVTSTKDDQVWTVYTKAKTEKEAIANSKKLYKGGKHIPLELSKSGAKNIDKFDTLIKEDVELNEKFDSKKAAADELQQYVDDKKITQAHLDQARKAMGDDRDLLKIFKALTENDKKTLSEADKEAVYMAKLNKADKVVQEFFDYVGKIDKDVKVSLGEIWAKKIMPPAIAFKSKI